MVDIAVKDSILNSIKKQLGIDAEYDVFDVDVSMLINSAFSLLHQLGVGPDAPYAIENDENVWSEFTNDDNMLNMVREYVFIQVRLIFDSTSMTSYLLTAFKDKAAQLEWRLNVYSEGLRYPS